MSTVPRDVEYLSGEVIDSKTVYRLRNIWHPGPIAFENGPSKVGDPDLEVAKSACVRMGGTVTGLCSYVSQLI